MADHPALNPLPSPDATPGSPAAWGSAAGAPGERAPGPQEPRPEPGEGPPGVRVADRLRGASAPTPAELVGLAVLLLGALVASVLWWYPAVTGPGGARATDGPPAAGVGAEVGPDGQAMGPAPGVGSGGASSGASGVAAGHAGGGAATEEPPGGGAADPDGSGPAAAPATATVTVHVTGGVVAAGVVTLPADARVGDAVAAAGGRTEDADLERINLARALVDGEHVHVPRVGEEPVVVPEASSGAGAVGVDGLLDLNRATAAELETLPGIGPTRAAAIVDHRERHGPFGVPGDLRAVSGIGEATFQTLAPLVVVR